MGYIMVPIGTNNNVSNTHVYATEKWMKKILNLYWHCVGSTM